MESYYSSVGCGKRIFARKLHSGGAAAGVSRPESLFTSPLWLRDTCDCPRCVDQSTRQKLFQTCDLPLNIEARIIGETENVIKVAWENDLPASGSEHLSTFQKSQLSAYQKLREGEDEDMGIGPSQPMVQFWNGTAMAQNMQSIDFTQYLGSEHTVFKALEQLKHYGLILITDVPSREDAVEAIASRIGHLRETFYGRTWDVKSVSKAKNVAYTNQFLGFHMDLLYMSDPPGLQLLHCLKNTCQGGESMFADGFNAAQEVKDPGKEDYHILSTYPQTFHYKNAGEHYRFTRPVITHENSECIEFVNWSPPFQGTFEGQYSSGLQLRRYIQAAKAFSSRIEAPENIYEYRMQEGDCVIFNNRRVLHARRAFDTASGERWLKGAYVDTDVFNSKFRVLLQKIHMG